MKGIIKNMEDAPKHTCPECGGNRIGVYVTDAKLVKTDLPQEPAWNCSSLTALVCTSCGYVTFYARELDNLVGSQTKP